MTPHPIIPQTPQQAVQRDEIAARRGEHEVALTPAQEIARLRTAIRVHQQAVGHIDGEVSVHDEALWAHLEPRA